MWIEKQEWEKIPIDCSLKYLVSYKAWQYYLWIIYLLLMDHSEEMQIITILKFICWLSVEEKWNEIVIILELSMEINR